MPFELQVALRYLLAKRRQVFISVISLVSTLGVTIGVMALVIALALMTGLQGELQSRILGSSAHVFVYKPAGITDYRAEVQRLSAVPGVIGAAPAVNGKALISALEQRLFIDQGHRREARVGRHRHRPRHDRRIARRPDAGHGGRARRHRARQGPGERYRREGRRHRAADDAERHAVADGRDAAATAFEGRRAVPHGPVRGRCGLRASSISTPAWCWRAPIASITSRSKVANVYDAPRIADQIAEQFGQDYVTQDWTDINQQLYSALLLEKIGMGIGIGLIVAVAALNIVASLILLVMEKTRDIAILKTMGASAKSIMLIFLLQGTIIGVIGTIVGATAGALTAYFLDRYRLITIPSDIYQVSYLPFKLMPGDLAAVVIGAVVVCFVATLYPSRQAARLDPAQALRYE